MRPQSGKVQKLSQLMNLVFGCSIWRKSGNDMMTLLQKSKIRPPGWCCHLAWLTNCFLIQVPLNTVCRNLIHPCSITIHSLRSRFEWNQQRHLECLSNVWLSCVLQVASFQWRYHSAVFSNAQLWYCPENFQLCV
jgi:hypothetical protein